MKRPAKWKHRHRWVRDINLSFEYCESTPFCKATRTRRALPGPRGER